MPAIAYSTLSVMELRRLAAAARARGDGAVADQADWEIGARLGPDGQGDPEAEAAFEADEAARRAAGGWAPSAFEAGDFEDDDFDDFEAEDFEVEKGASAAGGRPWRAAALVALGVVAG